jgi:hypothetical protein
MDTAVREVRTERAAGAYKANGKIIFCAVDMSANARDDARNACAFMS